MALAVPQKLHKIWGFSPAGDALRWPGIIYATSSSY
jgi:hypothetical protein